jgi:DtxR family Mn-dependent transcriptional regulator
VTDEAQYLLAIYIAENRQSPPVPFGTIAERVDRSPAAVTEMCQRLDDRGLVTYRPYGGVTLTDSGRETATDLHQRYVTLSWFFREVLELTDHETEAMDIARMISTDVTERLATTLLAAETPPDPSGDDRAPNP